jgi:hypothetical protein
MSANAAVIAIKAQCLAGMRPDNFACMAYMQDGIDMKRATIKDDIARKVHMHTRITVKVAIFINNSALRGRALCWNGIAPIYYVEIHPGNT